VFLYFGSLTLLVYLVVLHRYLLDIATTFMLKNQLRATAWPVTILRATLLRGRLFAFRLDDQRSDQDRAREHHRHDTNADDHDDDRVDGRLFLRRHGRSVLNGCAS
jgi:hypothetical protein